MPRFSRCLAVLCILVIVAGALFAPLTGGQTAGVLVALAPLFGLVVVASVHLVAEPETDAGLVSPLPSRAPPAIG